MSINIYRTFFLKNPDHLFVRVDLCVDVSPSIGATGAEDEEEEVAAAAAAAKNFAERLELQSERWNSNNTFIVDFEQPLLAPNAADANLLAAYCEPDPNK